MIFRPSDYSGANAAGGTWPPGAASALPNREGGLFSGGLFSQAQSAEVTYDTVTSADQAAIAESYAKSDIWSSAIQGISALATTGISLGVQSSMMKKQQAHESAMYGKQGELAVLQTQQANAQGVANQAAAAIQSLATTKTLLIVGGVVITFGLIGATVVAVRRGGDDYEDEYEDDYE